MTPAELLEAFEAFLAGLGLEPKEVGKTLGQFKSCGCGGTSISCADIVGCVKNLLELESVECAAIISMMVIDEDGTIVNSAGTPATVTANGDGTFEIEGSGAIQWWEITEQICPDPDQGDIIRYTLTGIGTKKFFAPAEEPCD